MRAPLLQGVLMAAILWGIAYRHRWRAAIFFPAYLVVGTTYKAAQSLGVFGPQDWLLWLSVHLVQSALTLALGVEIATRIFHRRLPGARVWTARAVLAIVGLGCAAAVAWAIQMQGVQGDAAFYNALVEAIRRLSATSLWVFVAAFWLALVRFGWPVDPYHRDLALGFAVYDAALLLLSPQAVASSFLPESWPIWLHGAVLLLWLRAAWRPIDVSHIAPELLPFVWPWVKVRP